MKTLKVILTRDASHAISDWDVEKWYQELLSSDKDTAYVATSIMLSVIRVGVRLKEVKPFTFEYEGKVVTCLEDGQLDQWHNGLFDQELIQLDCLFQGISREESRNYRHSLKPKGCSKTTSAEPDISKKKLTVVVTKDSSHAISVWDVEGWYQELLNSDKDTAYVATSTMFNEILVGVRLKEIEQFSFEYEGEVITCNEYGQLDKWSKGLFDHMQIEMNSLLYAVSREESRQKIHNENDNLSE